MISQNCRYSYYNYSAKTYNAKGAYVELSWQEAIQIFNTKPVESITGFSDCIIIRSKDSIMYPRYYYVDYDPDMIKNMFGISIGLDDILSSRIDKICQTGEQAVIWFMAKVLGNANADDSNA